MVDGTALAVDLGEVPVGGEVTVTLGAMDTAQVDPVDGVVLVPDLRGGTMVRVVDLILDGSFWF